MLRSALLQTAKLLQAYNPGQNSWHTNAIARQIEASSSPLPPRCSVDVMYSSFNSTQTTLLGGERESRNSPYNNM